MKDTIPGHSSSNESAPVIEGFRVIENLGNGATSSVWKAEQISLNRLVVIKVLSERLTHEPEDVTLFKAEARIAANFKHAGIVQVYDFGQSKVGQRYYFVMEYISGYSVGDWIRRKSRIAEHDALVVVQAVADALKYAWDLSRIVHCDIKPDNIMVDGDGSIKVADLGLAHTVKSMTNQPGANATEVVITGTPNYMAPEQVRGTEQIDCRADIYALGASLYHMVTGRLPFGDSTPDVVLERQLKEDFEYPQKVNPDLSTGVTRFILKMTAKDPAARFQTWDDVLAEVIRLERQMRNPESSASKKEDTRVETTQSFSYCPYCGKQVLPQALFCGFCGKSTVIPTKESGEDRKHMTIRLKPVQDSPAANAKHGSGRAKLLRTKPAADVKPDLAPPAPPLPAPRRRGSSLGKYIRVMISLCLLTFLGYYVYQKTKYDRDIIIPIKVALVRNVPPMIEKVNQYAEDNFPKTKLWLKKFFTTKTVSWSGGTPEDKPMPDQAATPPEAPEKEAAAVSESAQPAADDKAEESATKESAKSAAPEQSEPPALVSEPPKAEPVAAPTKSPEEAEYERILQTCIQQKPKVGDPITLQFKNERKAVEGVLEEVTADGVRVKVPAGVIEYPFLLIKEDSRLMYFPEERARRLQRQKSGRTE